jgi:hypothetical protein
MARTFWGIFLNKAPLDDLFGCLPRLTEVLRNKFCSREKKLFKKIGVSLP